MLNNSIRWYQQVINTPFNQPERQFEKRLNQGPNIGLNSWLFSSTQVCFMLTTFKDLWGMWWVRVRSIFCGLGRVTLLWFEFWFGKFPLKMSNFSILFLSSLVKKYLGQRRVGLLFTAGQKYKLGMGRVRAHLYNYRKTT